MCSQYDCTLAVPPSSPFGRCYIAHVRLVALQTGVLTIINSTVAHSVATTAGMVAAEGHASVDIMGSVLHDNRASAGAGGAFFLAVQ